MRRINDKGQEQATILIEDLSHDEQVDGHELSAEELLLVGGGQMANSGYVCSAPMNDCSKE